MVRSRLARLACLCACVVTIPIAAEEAVVKPHALDPRQQDRHSVLDGYKPLTELVTTTPPKTWTAAEVQPQPGFVGISLEQPKDKYWRIASVAVSSPAEKAGLKTGDAVVQIGGQPVVDNRLAGDYLRSRSAGEKVVFLIERNGEQKEIEVTCGSTSRPLQIVGTPTIGAFTSEVPDGVKVDRITPASPADSVGLKVGDIITRIDETPVTGNEVYTAMIASRKVGELVNLVVKRADKEMQVSVRTSGQESTGGGRRGGGGGRWDERTARTFKNEAYRLAVVLIEYPDVKHNPRYALADWERMLFSTGTYVGANVTGQPVYGSMNDFWREQSYGKFRVEGTAFNWVEVRKKRAEYATDTNRFALLTEALDKLLAREGDKALDNYDGVFFMYAGERYPTNRGGLYWPHRSNLMYKNKRWSYFICPEGGNRFSSISVLTHEFGHMLGLPDLYARPEAPGSEGLGIWCTMANGHGQDGKPRHMSAWCKEAMGWLKPTVVDPTVPQHIILGPITSSDRECLKVLIRKDGSEYFLLENRYQRGFDRDLPNEGLLIWRVVDGRPVLEESHGISGPEGPGRYLTVVPFPSYSNNAFTPFTTPSSRSQKGGGLPVHLTNIRKLPDGRVAFDLGYEYF